MIIRKRCRPCKGEGKKQVVDPATFVVFTRECMHCQGTGLDETVDAYTDDEFNE
jgi:DnaJ-class molecular chaperone